jgi:hypothetical protein
VKGSRRTQRGKILELLIAAHGEWVSLPEILGLGFAQFGARIFELRRNGHTILNKTEHRDGKVLFWYKLELATASMSRRSQKRPQPGLFLQVELKPAETRYPD